MKREDTGSVDFYGNTIYEGDILKLQSTDGQPIGGPEIPVLVAVNELQSPDDDDTYMFIGAKEQSFSYFTSPKAALVNSVGPHYGVITSIFCIRLGSVYDQPELISLVNVEN